MVKLDFNSHLVNKGLRVLSEIRYSSVYLHALHFGKQGSIGPPGPPGDKGGDGEMVIRSSYNVQT